MKITKIKGTLDFTGNEAVKYRYIEKTCTNIAKKFGFSEIITPIIEQTDCFVRATGEASDIVQKEMYTFLDRGERSITLRPEETACVMRHFVENKKYANPGLTKYYYFGPMFRYERPQAGRYRQFTQLGVECYGNENPLMDADIINMAWQMLSSIGVDNLKICINTIGGKESRAKYQVALKEYFVDKLDELCPDCKVRYQKNPLRMLDCKVDSGLEIMSNAPKIKDYLEDCDKEYFDTILTYLDALGLKYEISERMVRGLDYYTNDVFEIIYDNPKSQLNGLAVCAGGRYNDMGAEFDGPTIQAIGFAMGVERLMAIMDEAENTDYLEQNDSITVITLGQNAKLAGVKLTNYLRKNNLHAEIDYAANSLKPQFKLSERMNARYIIIIGEDEIANQEMTIKDTVLKTETKIKCSELNKYFNIEGSIDYAY